MAGVAPCDDVRQHAGRVTDGVFVPQPTAGAHPEPLKVAPVGLGPRVRRAHVRYPSSCIRRRRRRRRAGGCGTPTALTYPDHRTPNRGHGPAEAPGTRSMTNFRRDLSRRPTPSRASEIVAALATNDAWRSRRASATARGWRHAGQSRGRRRSSRPSYVESSRQGQAPSQLPRRALRRLRLARPDGPQLCGTARLLAGSEDRRVGALINKRYPLLQGVAVRFGHKLMRYQTQHDTVGDIASCWPDAAVSARPHPSSSTRAEASKNGMVWPPSRDGYRHAHYESVTRNHLRRRDLYRRRCPPRHFDHPADRAAATTLTMDGEKTFVPAVHTVRGPDGWTNECDVWPRARDPHSTRERGRSGRARSGRQEQTDHIVHDADGTIERRTSYRSIAESAPAEGL